MWSGSRSKADERASLADHQVSAASTLAPPTQSRAN
jgi:hypothetical protein